MSMYQTLTKIGEKFFNKATLFKYGFNFSPMYRRTTGRITEISDNLHTVKIKIPLSWKNVNYVGSIFGGSLLSATDPIYMIQLFQILGDNYVVWDKATVIKFKRPAKGIAYAKFHFTNEEIATIKKDVAKRKEVTLIKNLNITNGKDTIFCELEKTIYVAEKEFYKQKRNKRKKLNI